MATLLTAMWMTLLALAPLAQGASAVPVDIKAATDKQQITVGDVLTYTVEVLGPAGTTVSIPDAEKNLAPFELRDVHTEQGRTEDGRLRVTFTYQVAVFETGDKAISGLKLQYQTPDAKRPASISVPSVQVKVQSVLPPDAKDILDIREPVPARMGPEQWLAAALVALAILIPLALLGYLLYRRLSRPRPAVQRHAVIAAHEHALSQLASLHDSGLLAAGQLKAYYTRLSEILREYLEARYEVPAMEQTTWMIDRDLARAKVPQSWRDGLVGTLRRADLVKFARQEVAPEEAVEDLRRSREVVAASGPQAVDTIEEAAPSPAAAP